MKTKIDWNYKHIAISRTDSIGDVMLTLPMCAWFKKQYPTCKISFICKNYTAPLVEKYSSIDQIIPVDEFMQTNKTEQLEFIRQFNFDAVIHVFPNKQLAKSIKKAKVPFRIGTSHRLYHLFTCNIRPNFTRKNSNLHESQLNFELLKFFGLKTVPILELLNEYTSNFKLKSTELPLEIKDKLKTKYIVLHPKSQGSALEWPIEKYRALSILLIEQGYQVAFTGTEKEGALFRERIPTEMGAIDTTGKLTIDQLCQLINKADGLVACSTGPLHIAGFLNKKAVGLFSSRKPIHPGRWKPLGNNSVALVFDSLCQKCSQGQNCTCIADISVDEVAHYFID